MKYTDDWGNIHSQDVERPKILSQFFECSNAIDKHNQAHQAELALEKRWLTQNPFFRLHTTIIGMNVVDCYKFADFHNFINHQFPDKEDKMTTTSFSGFLAYQLICKVSYLTSFYNPVPQELRSLGITAHPEEVILSHGTQESVSLLTSGEKIFLSLQALKDANQVLPHLIAYEITVGGKNKKRTHLLCAYDKKCWLVRFGCYTCQKSFCCPIMEVLVDETASRIM
jgi:hypothetical protein